MEEKIHVKDKFVTKFLDFSGLHSKPLYVLTSPSLTLNASSLDKPQNWFSAT